MKQDDALALMKAPGDVRPGIWRGRVLQIKWTNACSLDCRNCTAAVGLAKVHKRIWFMSPDQFRTALRSLRGFPGVIGAFGGLPTLHPKFTEMCQVLVEEVPNKDQRGLWANDLRGKAALCRETFSAAHSNLNVHRGQKAYLEIEKDWPEAIAARSQFMNASLNQPSLHGSIFNAMQDVIPDEGQRWEKISKCYVNQTWSAMISIVRGELKAHFCEIASTRGEYADILGEPDNGSEVVPGWWAQPIGFFKDQVCHHCHRCGIPLNPHRVEDSAKAPEDFTKTNAKLYETERREGRLISTLEEVGSKGEAATSYLGDACMAVKS